MKYRSISHFTSNKEKNHFQLILILFFLPASLSAAIWQWSTEIKSLVADETGDHPQVFLWIPETCNRVEAVIVGMHNMSEENIFEHPHFRQAMSELNIAEIWITPGLNDPLFDISKGTLNHFNEILDSLAETSGYQELKDVPVIPIGHSAMATYPWNFGAFNPQRTLAMISIHGDAPLTNLTGCGRPNLDWQNHNIDGIPGLMVMGEYEWWEDRLAPATAYKNNHPESAVSLLADAGHGHFDVSDMLIDYLALFIKKTIKYRLPKTSENNLPVILKPVNPQKGWLADRWRKDSIPETPAAPYSQYKGNKKEAFWYFDQEMADATENYYAAARGKKEQYIGFIQNGQLLDFNPQSHARIHGRFEPEEDGLTFHLSAVFTDTLRSRIVQEHTKSKPVISRICGPVEIVNDTTFTVRFYHMGLNNPKRTGDIWLLANNPGDKDYKSTVQQLNIRIPYPNTKGKEQKITFNALPDMDRKTGSVKLDAVSDSNLPVYFYVKEGPAEIRDGQLVFTTIPPQSKFPVKVTVVAWQYGKSTAPEIQTAKPISHSFYIQ